MVTRPGILVIELELEQTLHEVLERRWPVAVAATSDEGLSQAEALQPFVVLCRLGGSRTDNQAWFNGLRKAASNARIFVLDDALDLNDLVHAINDCQIDRFIHAPVREAELVAQLEQAWEQFDRSRLDFAPYRAGISEFNKRILCVDDDQDILNFYHDILAPQTDQALSELIQRRARRRSVTPAPAVAAISPYYALPYDTTTATNGERAVRLVQEAMAQGKPFAAGFFDMKMPGGIDGLETIRQIRAIDPNMMCAVVTAYTDRSISEIQDAFSDQSAWIYFNKPFSEPELLQSAIHLINGWNSARRSESLGRFAQRMKHLFQRSRLTGSSSELQALVNRVSGHTAMGLLLADGVALQQVDPQTERMKLEFREGSLPDEVVAALGATALRQQEPSLLDARTSDRALWSTLTAHGFQAAISIPIQAEERMLGIVHLVSKNGSRRFLKEDLEVLHILVDHVAGALEHMWRRRVSFDRDLKDGFEFNIR